MIRTLPPFVLQTLAWIPTRLYLSLFSDFKVYGFEHLRGKSGPFIFAGNHTSELDPILVTAALPFFSPFAPVFYVAKKREFYEKSGPGALIYGGAFFKLWGAYPVREGLKNYKLSLNIHLDILRHGKCVLIFPEGEIAHGRILPTHGGVAFLSRDTQTPVVPVAIVRENKKTKIIFGEPLAPEKIFAAHKGRLGADEYKEAARIVMDAVRGMLADQRPF